MSNESIESGAQRRWVICGTLIILSQISLSHPRPYTSTATLPGDNPSALISIRADIIQGKGRKKSTDSMDSFLQLQGLLFLKEYGLMKDLRSSLLAPVSEILSLISLCQSNEIVQRSLRISIAIVDTSRQYSSPREPVIRQTKHLNRWWVYTIQKRPRSTQ